MIINQTPVFNSYASSERKYSTHIYVKKKCFFILCLTIKRKLLYFLSRYERIRKHYFNHKIYISYKNHIFYNNNTL